MQWCATTHQRHVSRRSSGAGDEYCGNRRGRRISKTAEGRLDHSRVNTDQMCNANMGQAQRLRALTKVWTDGCEKGNMKTCRRMLHQTKMMQMTIQKNWKIVHQQPGSMRFDQSRENWRCSRVRRAVWHALEVKQCCHRQLKVLQCRPSNLCDKCPRHHRSPKSKSHVRFSSMSVTTESRGEREEPFKR